MSNIDQNIECPLCMEPFEMDDFNFFPCTCGYQICRFCWHRIRTDENGLCPACRKQYPEDPADFKPLSVEEWQKIKSEKRQKDQQKKQKMSESRKHLDNVRVVQKNLVFVVGLPGRLAEAETLKKHDYFGKFGKIHKVVVNQSTSYAGSQGPSASAYVTYCRPEDALRAIGLVNNIQVDGRTLKASLGTTKYCSHFLKNQLCPKTDCMYLHELGDEAASFTKEDMQHGKHQEYEKKLQDQIIGTNITTNGNTTNSLSTNTKKQTTSQTPPQISPNSLKDSWPCTVQNTKESRTNRSKDNSQSQKSEGKNSRSKNKHTTEGQKSKKSKGKSSETAQNSNNVSQNSTKEENSNTQKKTQKGKHKDSTSSTQISVHSSTQKSESLQPSSGNGGKFTEVIEMNNKNAQQTTFVHITTEQQIQSKPVSASIKIARSESPVLPPSPISSSSSSLFTPFGSLSSNFLSSSSPSPPPSNNNPLTFCTLGGSTNVVEQGSPVTNFAAPAGLEQKQESQSPNSLFGNIESSESLFSHLNYIPVANDCGSYNGHMHNEEQPITDNSDWGSNYSFGDSQKQMPEDDLDFDPWNESSKGLADLMAKEAVHHSAYTDLPTPPGFFQPIKAPVPNQQRIGVPPPGFSSRQVPSSNSINHLPGMFGPSNTDYVSSKLSAFREQQQRQNLNGCTQQHFYPENPSIPLGLSNQYKQQQQFPQPNNREIMENLRLKKNLDDHFRTLFPDMLYHLSSRNLQKTQQTQNNVGPSWNQQQTQRDVSWLSNDSPMLNSGNITTENQRGGSPQLWMKALQHLQIEENSSQYNVHTSYTNPFALRGQWPAAQCPPPGFAPSRSPASTPYQHMQVNQKI